MAQVQKLVSLLMTLMLLIHHGETMDSAWLVEKVDALAGQLLTCKDMVGFSVGVVHHGEPLMTKGYGLANVEKNLPVTEKTLFGVASLSKAFAATLLVYLVDKHPKFTLDSPVRDILGPKFHFATCELTRHATLRDLMAHRTGMLPYNTARMQTDFTRDTLVKRIRFMEPKEELRTSYIYCNNMYGLLSKVTEVVGGDTWENLIRQHIFSPLGMESSTFTHETDLSSDNIAEAYQRDWRQNFTWRPMSQDLHHQWGEIGGAGSIITNAVDMIKWLQFQLSRGKDHHGNQVMPEAVVTETHTPAMVISEESCSTCSFYRKPYLNVTYVRNTYGLGWRVGFYRGERLVTHTGSSWGYTGMISLLPDVGIAVHVSVTGTDVNFEGRRALHMYIMDLLLGVEPQVSLENACSFPYYDKNATQQQGSDRTCYDNLPKGSQRIQEARVQPYLGTYGNFIFGNLTVFYNRSIQMVQMRYSQLGLWDLFATTAREHEFIGIGREHVWSMVLNQLVFSSKADVVNIDGDDVNKMTHLTVKGFEPRNPPVFERGLQYADAPPPEDCDITCSSGHKFKVTLWLALGTLLYMI